LIEALAWDMCDYGAVTEALKNALDALCTVPEDYHYLIGQLDSSDDVSAQDWIAGYYLRLGDEKNYLQVRQKHLETEAQYLELAEYWKQKGESSRYLDTLEEYVSKLTQKRNGPYGFHYPHTPQAGLGSVLHIHSSQVKQKQALSSPRVTAVDRLLEAAFCAVA
jgi:hypothetical protein